MGSIASPAQYKKNKIWRYKRELILPNDSVPPTPQAFRNILSAQELGGNDSVTVYGRLIQLDEVTDEPVAKPAHMKVVVRFLIKRKGDLWNLVY